MKKYLTLVGLSTLLLFTSCNKTSEVENYFNVKNTKGNEIVMLSDLYIASKGDTWALARILNTTPAVIERLKNGETKANDNFNVTIKKTWEQFQLVDGNFLQLKRKLDPKWNWIDTLGHLPEVEPGIFYGALITLFLALAFFLVIWFWFMWPWTLGGLFVYLLLWLTFLGISTAKQSSHNMCEDPYKHTPNSTIEIINHERNSR